jgi:hypothetical protein
MVSSQEITRRQGHGVCKSQQIYLLHPSPMSRLSHGTQSGKKIMEVRLRLTPINVPL